MTKRSYSEISNPSYNHITLLNNISENIRDLLFENNVCIHNVTYNIKSSTIVINNFKDTEISGRIYKRLSATLPNIVSFIYNEIVITIPT